MEPSHLKRKFERIGARLKVLDRPQRRSQSPALLTLDIGQDRQGEFFEIILVAGNDSEVEVLDANPVDRHLLLLVREDGRRTSTFVATMNAIGLSQASLSLRQ